MTKYPLFKGATRAPQIMGIPRNVAVANFAFFTAIAIAVWKPIIFLSIPIYFWLAKEYKKDPDALRTKFLFFKTTYLNSFEPKNSEYLMSDYSDEIKRRKE
ncbi:VirB3 family type IV secretion system protein [Dickeya dadantii]|uniref:VirB3 family type IV secretion system protein n=1 Tax=Dickeya dadantii TaxID=204038 RepID=UPI001496028D|nr:VirB3 family type IV secretion system protein [Dickeya dadantii]NPE57396.1 VirB3 family type IV secretion system protein [Dickeya dadantii]NPE68973.1 VirB3 family type IV secretion system protein [Dickeya dadantii]